MVPSSRVTTRARAGHDESERRLAHRTGVDLSDGLMKRCRTSDHLWPAELDLDGAPSSVRQDDHGVDLLAVRIAVLPDLATESRGVDGEIVKNVASDATDRARATISRRITSGPWRTSARRWMSVRPTSST